MTWRKFLGSEAGTIGLLFLRENTPSIQQGDANSIVFNAGRYEGYKQAIDMLSEVVSIEEKPDQNLEN